MPLKAAESHLPKHCFNTWCIWSPEVGTVTIKFGSQVIPHHWLGGIVHIGMRLDNDAVFAHCRCFGESSEGVAKMVKNAKEQHYIESSQLGRVESKNVYV